MRTQLLISSMLSAAFFLVISFPLTSWITRQEVDQREKVRLNSARTTFQKALTQFKADQGILTSKKLEYFFNSLLANIFPDDDTFLIAIKGSEFFSSSPKSLPVPLRPGTPTFSRWTTVRKPEEGEISSKDPKVGSILYELIPIKAENQKLGAFVIVITTAGEQMEALESTQLVQRWFMLLYFASLLILWLRASALTNPLRKLTAAINDIQTGNLSSRLAIDGNDELAVLGERFNSMLDQIEALVSSQREFIGDVSHELRTPITIIRGHTELLLIEPQKQQQETIRLLLDEIDRISRIVGDLSLLARSDRPEFLELRRFSLQSFLEDIFRKTRLLTPRNWQLIHSNDTKGGLVVGDPQRLTQCLLNLLVNASQHTEEHARITLGGSLSSNGWLKLWVSDEGQGVPAEMHGRIFERFRRGKRLNGDDQGSGLGLAIVDAVARAHGGRVELESKVGYGSTFSILIPQRTNFSLKVGAIKTPWTNKLLHSIDSENIQ